MAWHYMRRNDSTALPRYVVWLDTETYPDRLPGIYDEEYHQLRLGVARFARWINGRWQRVKEIVFEDRRDFWSWFLPLTSSRHTTWLVAHNLGFDLTVIGTWRLLERGTLKFCSPGFSRARDTKRERDKGRDGALVVIGDPPTIFGFESQSGGRFVAVDTLNWFCMPLSTLGASVGSAKLPMPSQVASHDDWVTYCRQDVDVLQTAWTALMQFIVEHDLGMFRYTAPAQAMGAFRHRFMETQICLHDEDDVKELERSAYYGGQTECYWVGPVDKHIYQYDVNSLYPYVMHDNPVPVKLLAWDLRATMTERQPDIRPPQAICEVELETDLDTYPVRHDGRPYYVTGTYRTVLCGPELMRAVAAGQVKRYGRWAMYDVEPIFYGYVDTMRYLRDEYRREGNRAFELLAKLMLNSLHGKFGQRSPQWVHEPDTIAPHPWCRWETLDMSTGCRTRRQCIGDYVFRLDPGGEHQRSFPAIAAWVTAYGREYMRRLRILAGRNHVYYQATDSLAVDAQGRLNLDRAKMLSQSEWGKLKLLCAGPTAQFWGVNHYRIGSKHVIGGRKRGSKPLPDGGWVCDEFDGLMRSFEHGGPTWITVRSTDRYPTGQYTKGRHEGHGRVTPLHLPIDDIGE